MRPRAAPPRLGFMQKHPVAVGNAPRAAASGSKAQGPEGVTGGRGTRAGSLPTDNEGSFDPTSTAHYGLGLNRVNGIADAIRIELNSLEAT